jgi:hypothetical protein
LQEATMNANESVQPADSSGRETKRAGKGPQGTIPDSGQGIGIGASDEANTFEPEEDPEATE